MAFLATNTHRDLSAESEDGYIRNRRFHSCFRFFSGLETVEMNIAKFLEKLEFYMEARQDLSISEMLRKAYWYNH